MEHSIQCSLHHFHWCRLTEPDKPWIDARLQHNRQPLPTWTPEHLLDQHWLRSPEACKRRASAPGTMEPWSLWVGGKRFRICVLRFDHYLFLLPNEPARGFKLGELGPTGVGRGNDHISGFLSSVWQASLHCARGICRREAG